MQIPDSSEIFGLDLDHMDPSGLNNGSSLASPLMDRREVEQYIHDKFIHELFQSLTVALVIHRPEDHLDFLRRCLRHIQDTKMTPNMVTWDSLVPVTPSGVGRAGNVGQDGRRRTSLPPLRTDISGEDERSLVTFQLQAKENLSEGKMMLSQVSMGDDDWHQPTPLTPDVGSSPPAYPEDDNEMVSQDDILLKLHPRAPEILRGAIDDLPAMPSNVVRVFLSSTFSDFKAERNMLPREVYPVLQTFCSERGLEFQVVDMRWGVTDDVIDDHQVSDLCIQEILICQQVSRGPNFVTLLGNRYGYQSFPSKIKAEEFKLLQDIAEKENNADSHLLSEWFRRDDNSINPEFILQPINHILPDYHNRGTTEEDIKRRKAATVQWQNVFNKLLQLIRHCVDVALKQGSITEEARRKYYKSVTEEEVDYGLLKVSNPELRALAYIRDLDGLVSRVDDKDASRFIDLVDQGQINGLAASLRQKLTDEQVPKKLPKDNIKNYVVPWLGHALERSEEEKYKNYLSNFCIDFLDDMTRLIRSSIEEEYSTELDKMQNLYQEVLHHNRFTVEKTHIFCGREAEIDRIKAYLTKTKWSNHNPLIVTSKSGYGKTALLAYVAKNAKEWMGEEACVVVRYLGTSPQSSNIGETLKSLITQISVISKLMLPNEDKLGTFADIRQRFWRRLEKVGKTRRPPILIILDSVDQLQRTFGAYNMIWLLKKLPPKVFILVSMLSDRFDCLENTKQRVKYPENYIELEPLSTTSADMIIDCYLSRVGRTVSADQRQLILSKFNLCSQPLFLRLTLDYAKAWNSYTPLDDIVLGDTVHSVINLLFAHLEKKQGAVFIRHALGYLTCSKTGLSGLELEDVLSCDDEVLNEVYQHHDPPIENLIRIPSLMWSRLQYHLKDYLAERQVDGKTVLGWYHRQFWETAEERYLNDDSQRDFVEQLHSNLADVFLQEDGIQRTIVLHQREDKVLQDCDRGVTPQPLHSKNLRKLRALPQHLIAANRIEILKERCILNFEWVLIKLHAYDTFDVLREYDNIYSQVVSDPDMVIFTDFLALCADAIWADPLLLAYNCVERLSRYSSRYPSMEQLVFDAKRWLATTNNPVLIPCHKLNFQNPDSPLKLDILCGCDGIVSRDGLTVACKWQERTAGTSRINVLNLKDKEVLTSMNTGKANYYAITKNGSNLVYADQLVLYVREMESGDKVKHMGYHDQKYERVSVRCMALGENDRLVAVGFRHGKPLNIKDDNVWKSGAKLVVIDIKEKKVLGTTSMHARKCLEAVHFINDDKQIIVTTKERLQIVDTYTLEVITEYTPAVQELCPTLSYVFLKHKFFAVAMQTASNAKILLYDYESREPGLSENTHLQESQHIHPVAFCADEENLKVVTVVSETKPEAKPNSCLCTWDYRNNAYRKVLLSSQEFKLPTAVAMSADWTFAFVGWANGNLVIVDVDKELELYDLQIQGQAINFMKVIDFDESLITMSTDHSVKKWKLSMLVEKAHQEWVRKNSLPITEELSISPVLDENQECLDLDMFGRFVVTVPPESDQAPQFWTLRDGRLEGDITAAIQEQYNNGCEQNNSQFDGKTHGEIQLIEDELFSYMRAKRNEFCLSIFSGFEEPKLLRMRHFNNAFFNLFAKVPNSHGGEPELLLFVLMDSSLDIYSVPHLTPLGSIATPSLTKEIPNMHSSGGKKKLMFYKTGVTADGKYFVFLNPGATITGKNFKPFHLVDLHNRKYDRLVELPKHVSFTLMSDSFCFMVWNRKIQNDLNSENTVEPLEDDCKPAITIENGHAGKDEKLNDEEDNTRVVAEEPLVLSPQVLQQLKQEDYKDAYMCLLLSKTKLLSQDRYYGLDIRNKKRVVNVWCLDPVEKLHSLKGHVHEISSAHISDNCEFVVTGSCDKTVRVWRLLTGQQLCTFHVDGSVSDVMFDVTASYVVVHSYAAPQRKRAIILRMQNKSTARKLSRYFSKQDF